MNFEELKYKYEGFLDSLAEKGLPKPAILVPAIFLATVIGAALLLTPGLSPFAPETSDVSLKVFSQEGDAVRMAVVTLYNEDGKEWSGTTDDYGRVEFKGVNYESLKASIDASGYQAYRMQPVTAGKTVYLDSSTPPATQVTVRVRDSTGHDVEGAQVVLLLDDGTTEAGRTDAFGEIGLEVPGEMDSTGTVQANADGFQSNQKTVYKYEWESPIVIELSRNADEHEEESVNAYVLVEDGQGNPLKGIIVSLSDSNTQAAQRQGQTDSSGAAEFTGVPNAWQFKVNAFDPSGVYAAYASTESFTAGGEAARIRLEKKEAGEGELRVSIAAESGEALAGANIMVFERLSGSLLAEANTGADGKATIAIAKNKEFYLTAYKEGYLPAQDFVSSGETKKLMLEKAVAGSTAAIKVHAKDAVTGEPAPNALVTLFKADGFQLGYPAKRTGADGITAFNIPKNLAGTAYDLVAAASLGYKKGRSDAVQAYDEAELFIVLEPVPGTITAEAVDASNGETIDGARITLWADGEALEECGQNPCDFSAAPETELYLTAESDGYLDGVTVNKIVAPGETLSVQVELYPRALADSLSITFDGLYDSNGEKVEEAANAEYFTARFLVNVPSSELEEATASIKLGDAVFVEDEAFAIKSVNAPRTEISKGSYLDAECGETIESEEGEYAPDYEYYNWVRAEFPKGFTGTAEIEVELFSSPSAQKGDESTLYYHAYAEKSGLPVMSPLDQSLLTTLMGKKKLSHEDYCFAEKRSQKLVIGSDTLKCGENYCTALWFEYDGRKQEEGFEVEAGKEFQLGYEVLALNAPLASLELDYPSQLESSAGERVMQADAAIGEKTSGKISFTALRAVSLAEIALYAYGDDAAQATEEHVLRLKVTGTNKFKVMLSPESMIAGLNEKVRATVLDQFSRPVEDAWVNFYDCENYPLNGQEIDLVGDGTRDNGENGKYAVQLNPSTIGTVGVRVQRDGFNTYESCELEALAGDFLLIEPEVIEFSGTSTGLGKTITLTSRLPVESRVSTSVRCYRGFEETGALVYASPQSFKLEDQAQVNVVVEENVTAKADCYVSFTARVNARSKTEETVLARLNVQGPPAPLCPHPYACLTESEADARGCSEVTAYGCASGFGRQKPQKCYSCEIGSDTLPDSIELTVSNAAPTDSESFLISLYNAPEECAVDGFNYAPSTETDYYSSQYAGMPSNYWGYQANSWQSPPWQQLQVDYSMQGYYQNVGSLYEGYASGGFGAPYSTGIPDYCRQYPLNMQGMQGNYQYSTYGRAASSYGYGLPAACQYPAVCTNPGACSYSSTGSYYGNQMPYACQYPAVCSNPYACPYTDASYSTAQYGAQSKPPVQVTIGACNDEELEVTASYTGADYYQNAGMGGTQKGFIVVKLGPGETRRIPVTVTVEDPQSFAGTQQGMPFAPMIPPECYAGIIQGNVDSEGLDEYGLPDEIELLVNPHTGKAHYSREINAIGNVLYKWKEKPKGIASTSISRTKISVEYEDDEFGEDDDGEIEMWIAGHQTQPKTVDVTITEDDFTPSIIQLLATQHGGDQAEYETGEEGIECDDDAGSVKIDCDDGVIAAKATKYASSNKYSLEVTEAGDHQIREIPVRLAYTEDLEEGGEESDYRVAADSTISFTKSDWLVAPGCGDLAKKEGDCTPQKIVVRNDADERVYSWSPDERDTEITTFVYGGQGECREVKVGEQVIYEKNNKYYEDAACTIALNEQQINERYDGGYSAVQKASEESREEEEAEDKTGFEHAIEEADVLYKHDNGYEFADSFNDFKNKKAKIQLTLKKSSVEFEGDGFAEIKEDDNPTVVEGSWKAGKYFIGFHDFEDEPVSLSFRVCPDEECVEPATEWFEWKPTEEETETAEPETVETDYFAIYVSDCYIQKDGDLYYKLKYDFKNEENLEYYVDYAKIKYGDLVSSKSAPWPRVPELSIQTYCGGEEQDGYDENIDTDWEGLYDYPELEISGESGFDWTYQSEIKEDYGLCKETNAQGQKDFYVSVWVSDLQESLPGPLYDFFEGEIETPETKCYRR